ncbi:MAG: gamma-glutamylcyclotransferase [bacterium]
MNKLFFLFGEQLSQAEYYQPLTKAVLPGYKLSFTTSGISLLPEQDSVVPGIICRDSMTGSSFPVTKSFHALISQNEPEVIVDVDLPSPASPVEPQLINIYNLIKTYSCNDFLIETFIETLNLDSQGLFLYGTEKLIDSYQNTFMTDSLPQPAFIPGKIITYEDYFTYHMFSGNSEVSGKFFQFTQNQNVIMEKMDNLFEFNGFGHPRNLYERIIVPVKLDSDEYINSWIYYVRNF